MIIKLGNPNPTEAEKQLFLTAGYYCIDEGGITVNNNETEFKQVTYAVLHGLDSESRKTFPQHVEIDNKGIDYESTIVFDTLSETVKISDYLDIDHISFVIQRMNELGFKRCLTSISNSKLLK